MRKNLQLLVGLSCLLLAFGCSLIQSDDDASVAKKLENLFGEDSESADQLPNGQEKVANPPAKTIRFDGSEVVLGINDVTQIAADQFGNG